jgi:hypothetical protein
MRLRVKRIVSMLAVAVILGAGACAYFRPGHHTYMVQYRKEVQQGETVWDICSEIATDKEDLNKLVWQTMKDNRIKDPNDVQPGMLLVVNVEQARGAK